MKKRYTGIIAIVAVAAGLLAGTALSFQPALPAAVAAPPERIDVSRPSALLEVRSLGQLVSYGMEFEKIVEAGTWGGNAFQQAWYKDHLLLIANGEVTAGFDLRSLPESSVTETETTVTVNLGSPQIIMSRLDNEKTRVYERDVGTFNSPDEHLESRARQQAEATLRQAACQSGILQKAGTDGANTVKTLLERVFLAAHVQKTVRVIFTPGECPTR